MTSVRHGCLGCPFGQLWRPCVPYPGQPSRRRGVSESLSRCNCRPRYRTHWLNNHKYAERDKLTQAPLGVFIARRLSLDLLVSKVLGHFTQPEGIVYGLCHYIYISSSPARWPLISAALRKAKKEEMTFFYGENIRQLTYITSNVKDFLPPSPGPTIPPNVPHIRSWFFPLTGPWKILGISRLCAEMKTHKNPFLRWLVNIFLFFRRRGASQKDIEEGGRTEHKGSNYLWEILFIIYCLLCRVCVALVSVLLELLPQAEVEVH